MKTLKSSPTAASSKKTTVPLAPSSIGKWQAATKCLAFVAGVLLVQNAYATSAFPFMDHFNYATPNNLGSQGNSWNGSQAQIAIASGNLDGTPLGLYSSLGNMVSVSGSTNGSTYNQFASSQGEITNGS